MAKVLAEDFDDGIKTAEQALAIFKELELRKLEAFELFIIAHYYLTRKMGREAIPYAEDIAFSLKEGFASRFIMFMCLTHAWRMPGRMP